MESKIVWRSDLNLAGVTLPRRMAVRQRRRHQINRDTTQIRSKNKTKPNAAHRSQCTIQLRFRGVFLDRLRTG